MTLSRNAATVNHQAPQATSAAIRGDDGIGPGCHFVAGIAQNQP
jgi:hypothetical protein